MEMNLKSQKNKALSATRGGIQLLQMQLQRVKSTHSVYKCRDLCALYRWSVVK